MYRFCFLVCVFFIFSIRVTVFGQEGDKVAKVLSVVGSDASGVYPVVLNDTTLEKPQELILKGLVPGKLNRVSLKVKNDSRGAIKIEKVIVSCGCMVVKDFGSDMAGGAESKMEMEIKVGLGPSVEKREIAFDSGGGKVWRLILDCRPVKIFDYENRVFEVGCEDVRQILKLEFDKTLLTTGLAVGSDAEIKCSSRGTLMREARITRVETGVEVDISVDWNNFGLRKTMTEFIEVSFPDFSVALPVEFRNKSVVRVSPSTCSSLRLLSGQRFLLSKDTELGDLGVRGVSSKGEHFEMNIVEKVAFGSGNVIEVSGKEEDIPNVVGIEVYELAKPGVVLSRIVVQNLSLSEGSKNVR